MAIHYLVDTKFSISYEVLPTSQQHALSVPLINHLNDYYYMQVSFDLLASHCLNFLFLITELFIRQNFATTQNGKNNIE